jgi:hypothetical protein
VAPTDAIVSHDDRGNPIMQSEVDAALALEIEGARLYFGVDVAPALRGR